MIDIGVPKEKSKSIRKRPLLQGDVGRTVCGSEGETTEELILNHRDFDDGVREEFVPRGIFFYF